MHRPPMHRAPIHRGFMHRVPIHSPLHLVVTLGRDCRARFPRPSTTIRATRGLLRCCRVNLRDTRPRVS